MDILKTIDRLWLDGTPDRTEDGSARLIRPVTIGGKPGTAMVYTTEDFALIVFAKPSSESKGKTEYRNVLVDSFGTFGKRGHIYADITTTDKRGNSTRKAVPGVTKYIQPCADIMTARIDKRFVARDYSDKEDLGEDRVTDYYSR